MTSHTSLATAATHPFREGCTTMEERKDEKCPVTRTLGFLERITDFIEGVFAWGSMILLGFGSVGLFLLWLYLR